MESPPWPGNFSDDRKIATQGLINGHKFASELRIIVQNLQGVSESMVMETLVEKTLKSIEGSYTALNSNEGRVGGQNPANIPACLSFSDEHINKLTDESVKIPVAMKDRRRPTKRRRTTTETWTKVSAAPRDDGHAWRKYGQKEILGAKYPRCYFRCTHKNDQECQAIKQVQRREDDPSTYLITYMGQHTCKDLHKNPKFVFNSPQREPFLLNFQSPLIRKQENPCFSSSSSIKQETYQEKLIDLHHNIESVFHMLPELTELESYGQTLESDSGDVASGVYTSTSPNTLNFDPMVDSVQFDDFFNFGEGDLL
ncbi:WRKY DNA-binding transcription factor 70-like [Tasmannia lanceolata]|uniref:WRKY DNA-binding transcription factor 70-like n=1 Tax=Tasmannia lanceolata TaxID=3420 RepID=UPI0040640AC7